MKTILFSVQEPLSTPFTLGAEVSFISGGYRFVKIPYDEIHTDILIQDGVANFPSNGLTLWAQKAHLRHSRYHKWLYNDLINRAAVAVQAKDYEKLESYRDSFAIPYQSKDKFLLRPKFGARGLGFIEIPYPQTTVNALETLVSKWANGNVTDEFFNEKLKAIGGKISQSPNVTSEEVKLTLKEGFDFVKIIPDVTQEFRIITDHRGEPKIVVERKLNDYGLSVKQASGGYQNTDTIVEDFFEKNSGRGIEETITALEMPIHSFDLFFTARGTFGFFEACNQFGCTTVPDGFVRNETIALLKSIANKLKEIDGHIR